MRPLLTVFCYLLSSPGLLFAQKVVSLTELAARAVTRSQITTPDSKPFHLVASLNEKGNDNSPYKATVEMFWFSPTKWRRTISSANFSQVRVVNGNEAFEENKGDYFPVWLNNMVTSIFDPLPMLAELQKSGAETPRMAEMTASGQEACSYLNGRIDRWVFCFQSDGLLSSVFSKGYAAQFKKYSKFGDKRVPRMIECDPEPGTHLETHITILEELKDPSEKLFVIERSTPPSEQIARVRVSDDFIRKAALNGTEIDWPTVGEGKLTGGCAVYISADRKGQIQEAWPGGCDNAALEEPLRKALLTWKLRPAVSNGNPVQLESLMGFTFHTQLDSAKSLPNLSNEQVRALATKLVPPQFPPNSGTPGTEFTVNISVDQTGKLTGAGPAPGTSDKVFFAIYSALTKWQFQPYILNGKPQYFHGVLTFRLE